MPRIPRPPSPEVRRARSLLEAHLERERTTVNAFSRKNNLVQSTVQRLLSGRTKSVTPAVSRILYYANIDLKSGITEHVPMGNNPRLERALLSAWDGDPDVVELLARLIEAIGSVLKRR